MGESHAAFAAMETTLNWIVPENINHFFLIVCVSWTQTLLNIVTVWEQEGV